LSTAQTPIRTTRVAGLLTGLALVTVTAAACGSDSTGASSSPSNAVSSSPAMSGTITVFAAASLKESFTTLGKQFEAAHPGTTVKFSFAASSTLAQQILAGAPADVFASASPSNMTQVKADVGTPQNFAKNSGEIAVPPDNPAKVDSVADLAQSGVKVAVCAPEVPCGKLATQIEKNAGITIHPVTQAPDVKSTLAVVESGEVDAGIVYVTDVKAAGDKVLGVVIPSAENSTTTYPIAEVTASKQAAVANAFVALVLDPAGQQVLQAAGFQAP
jgi:molybdate transport system substrate-binding protein